MIEERKRWDNAKVIDGHHVVSKLFLGIFASGLEVIANSVI